MKSKGNVNYLNQSKLVVDYYEMDFKNEVIVCELYDEKNLKRKDCILEVEVPLRAFEKWMEENNLLKGKDERCVGFDHTGEPVFETSTWDYTLEEYMNDVSGGLVAQVIALFINHTKNFKELSK